jgi:hypothetical protein
MTVDRPPEPDWRTEMYIELWKQTVQVQMHFNDIEMKIRTAAITVLTFVLGAASLSLREGETIAVLAWKPPLATLVLTLGCLLWGAFYFVDQWWYHRLLLGSVTHGEDLEVELRKQLPAAGLTIRISEMSAKELRPLVSIGPTWTLHSRHKMGVFYGVIFALMAGAAAVLWLASASR